MGDAMKHTDVLEFKIQAPSWRCTGLEIMHFILNELDAKGLAAMKHYMVAAHTVGVADRIDLLPDGKGVILDYKTGQVPTQKQIESFLAPQLLLEAAMLAAGAFPGVEPREAEALLYLQISGGRVPGTIREVDISLIGEALEKLKTRIADFMRPDTSYDPRLHPKQARVSGDYDHLARVREWSISGWEAPEE